MIEFGLFLIAMGWLIQLSLIIKGQREVSAFFLGFYCVGLAILVIKGFNLGPTLASYLNAAALFCAVFSLILRKL